MNKNRKNSRATAMKLFTEHRPLAYWCLSRFCKRYRVHPIDHENSSLIGLWHAATFYSAEQGYKFSSYAVKCCNGTMITSLIRDSRTKRFIVKGPIRMPLPEDCEWSSLFLGMIERALRPRQLLAIRLRYFDGLTLVQAGEKLGVGKERVRQIVGGALRKIRDRVADAEVAKLTESPTSSGCIALRGRFPINESASFENVARAYEELES